MSEEDMTDWPEEFDESHARRVYLHERAVFLEHPPNFIAPAPVPYLAQLDLAIKDTYGEALRAQLNNASTLLDAIDGPRRPLPKPSLRIKVECWWARNRPRAQVRKFAIALNRKYGEPTYDDDW